MHHGKKEPAACLDSASAGSSPLTRTRCPAQDAGHTDFYKGPTPSLWEGKKYTAVDVLFSVPEVKHIVLLYKHVLFLI